MMGTMRVLSLLVVGIAWLVASVETASAQTIVRAVYRVSLTDSATGSVYFTDRQSVRSWDSEERCEREKNSFSGCRSIHSRRPMMTQPTAKHSHNAVPSMTKTADARR